MSFTRPTGEQLRFRSSQTGEHVLDDYLEAAELGGRRLAELLSDIFDGDGNPRIDLIQLRINSTTRALQMRLFSDWPNGETGWINIPNATIFRHRGAYSTGTSYNQLDIVTYNNSTYVCVTAHTSAGSSPNTNNFKLLLNSAYLDSAVSNASASASSASASASSASASAQAAADSAAQAASYIGSLSGTSSTAVTIGTGFKSFTTQPGKLFDVGTPLQIVSASDPVNVWMAGISSSYNSSTGALTVNVSQASGSGTRSDWTIRVSGASGDLTHASRTDNPHQVTAAQTGAVAKAGDVMTGTLETPALSVKSANPAQAQVSFFDRNGDNSSNSIYRASGALRVRDSTAATDIASATASEFRVTSSLSLVWHAGNFDPNAKANVSSPTISNPTISGTASFTGAILAGGSSIPHQYTSGSCTTSISVRGYGLEFGHANQAGYGSTLSAEQGNGKPFLAFHAGPGTNNNTYRTFGHPGSIFRSRGSLGGWSFAYVSNANADNQTATEVVTIDGSGNIVSSGSLTTASGVTAASLTATGTGGNVSKRAATTNPGSLTSLDTQNTPAQPNGYTSSGTYNEFKKDTDISWPGANGANYAHVITVSPSSSDSGGGVHQLAFVQGGSLGYRYGTRTTNTWTSWGTVWHSQNFDPNTKANTSSPSFTGTAQFNGAVQIGTPITNQQHNARLSIRGYNLEFGHANQGGYGCVLGNESGNGRPFLAFYAGPGTNANTYKTLGLKAAIMRSGGVGSGNFVFSTLANDNADNQAPVDYASINPNGEIWTSLYGNLSTYIYNVADARAAAYFASAVTSMRLGVLNAHSVITQSVFITGYGYRYSMPSGYVCVGFDWAPGSPGSDPFTHALLRAVQVYINGTWYTISSV